MLLFPSLCLLSFHVRNPHFLLFNVSSISGRVFCIVCISRVPRLLTNGSSFGSVLSLYSTTSRHDRANTSLTLAIVVLLTLGYHFLTFIVLHCNAFYWHHFPLPIHMSIICYACRSSQFWANPRIFQNNHNKVDTETMKLSGSVDSHNQAWLSARWM